MPYTPGPFSDQHLYMQWGGKLPGNEQWSCGLRLACHKSSIPGIFGVILGDPSDWLHGAIKTAVQEYHQRALTCINPLAKLSYVKLNRIGTDGHYTEPVTYQHIFADIAGGGGVYNQTLNQSALAVSLTTGYSRGPAHRGRFYLPMPAVQLGTDGLMAAGVADNIAESTKTFLEAVADVPGIDDPTSITPVVMSRKAGAPAYREITGVQVGRVVDTQRKRRRSLVENYISSVLDLGAN